MKKKEFIPFVLLFFSFLIPLKSFADFCEQYDFGKAGTQYCREGDTITYYLGAFGNQGCITGPNFVKLCGDDDPFIIAPVMLLLY